MARIIMCGSFKGGVGKTASSWNLAYSLAEMGKRVLAVDFDSQANLTTCFGIEDPAAVLVTIGHLMMKRLEDEEMPDLSEFIQSRNSVDFISSSMMLSYIYAALQGGSIMRKWTNDDRMMIACCNDGTRPVIFKIERIDIPENEEEKQWLEKQNFKNTADDAYTG